MSSVRQPATVAFGLLALATIPAGAQTDDPPPAHAAYVDGSVLLDRDGFQEALDPGMPLIEGDRVITGYGRAELLTDTGTTLFVDDQSTLDVLSFGTWRLASGTLVLDVPPDVVVSDRVSEVATPAASVVVERAGIYWLSTDPAMAEVRLARGTTLPTTTLEVVAGTALFASDTAQVRLTGGERSTVVYGDMPTDPSPVRRTTRGRFADWIDGRRGQPYRGSASAEYLPASLRTYSSTLVRYGEWRTEPSYGTVWYPTVAPGWRPYYDGRWAWVGTFGWTWVGASPWAWPTHHYGRWSIGTAGHWFWVPGPRWGPAWVSWAVAPSYVSWSPLGPRGWPVVPFSNRSVVVAGRVFGVDFAWTTIPTHVLGARGFTSRYAVAGRPLLDRGNVRFVTQRTPPGRSRTIETGRTAVPRSPGTGRGGGRQVQTRPSDRTPGTRNASRTATPRSGGPSAAGRDDDTRRPATVRAVPRTGTRPTGAGQSPGGGRTAARVTGRRTDRTNRADGTAGPRTGLPPPTTRTPSGRQGGRVATPRVIPRSRGTRSGGNGSNRSQTGTRRTPAAPTPRRSGVTPRGATRQAAPRRNRAPAATAPRLPRNRSGGTVVRRPSGADAPRQTPRDAPRQTPRGARRR